MVSYSRQCELITQLRSSIKEITDFFESLEREIETLRQWHAELDEKPGGTPGAEDEELTQFELEQQALISRLISHLSAQRDALKSEEEKLEKAYQRLAAKVSGWQ